MSSSPAFHDAAVYLSNASSLSKVSTTIKLESIDFFQQLYGLFKYVTVSPTPNTSRPSIFDMAGRAKWDAWSAASQKYGTRVEAAEQRYLVIAMDLGWKEGTLVSGPPEPQTSMDTSAEGSSEDIENSDTSPSSASGGGMGLSVSAMAPPPLDEQDAKTLHGLAISNNAAGLAAHLNAHPDISVDEFDEHGYTPLHLACDRGNSVAVELLLSRGADRSLQDPDDFTALELAKIAGHDDIVLLIDKSQ